MSGNRNKVQLQFSRNATSYDAHARVQRLMSNRLMQLFGDQSDQGIIAEPDILEIGCGTGDLTMRLANARPTARITALDLAPEMIKIAETRFRPLASRNRLRFLLADVETWAIQAPSASYDLIVSNACFQWLSDPLRTLIQLRRLLRPEGRLVFSTFGPSTFHEMHEAFNEAYRTHGVEPQRHGLAFQSSCDWEDMLVHSGFSNISYESSASNEIHATARHFLRSVKAMGASTSEATAVRSLSPRALFNSMYIEYEKRFSVNGGIVASYELLWFKAFANN